MKTVRKAIETLQERLATEQAAFLYVDRSFSNSNDGFGCDALLDVSTWLFSLPCRFSCEGWQ